MSYFLTILFILNGHLVPLESQFPNKASCENAGFASIVSLSLNPKIDLVDYSCLSVYPKQNDEILQRITKNEF